MEELEEQPVDSTISQEELGMALQDLVDNGQETAKGIMLLKHRGWCQEGPITEGGKLQQMVKMLTLILTPIIVLLCVSFYFVSQNIVAKMEADEVRNTILFSVEVGKLVHVMQEERDMSVLYLSSIAPETRTFLTERYLQTDEQLVNLASWPADLDMYNRSHFSTQRSFQNYLTKHRNELDLLNLTVYDEILFYSDEIKVFVRWLYRAIIKSKYGNIWKSLVAYQKVVVAKENVGVERALGTAYFLLGGFVTHSIYEWYNEKLHVYNANIASAVRYSDLVNPIVDARILNGKENLTNTIELFRSMIQNRHISKPSLKMASWYYDNMTLYVDLILVVQNNLAYAIIKMLDDRTNLVSTGVIVSSIIILIIIIMCPLLIRMVQSLMNNIQNYAITLVEKTRELKKEKKKTDTLFYQMLPKSVGEKLKKNKNFTAQYHKEVTIFFSDIVGFTYLTMELSPMEIVALLNRVYTVFDDRIDQYDVYKVETIGDSYMVASGLPKCNGIRHSSEIANMSLDLKATTTDLEIDIIPQKRINLRIGIHTGPCVAGVLGAQLPRYCLFGDTVNTASRMETTGLANRIHISITTYRLLARNGGYILQMRGPIEVKGKGRMVTYWLMGHAAPGSEQYQEGSGSPDNMVSEHTMPGSPMSRKKRQCLPSSQSFSHTQGDLKSMWTSNLASQPDSIPDDKNKTQISKACQATTTATTATTTIRATATSSTTASTSQKAKVFPRTSGGNPAESTISKKSVSRTSSLFGILVEGRGATAADCDSDPTAVKKSIGSSISSRPTAAGSSSSTVMTSATTTADMKQYGTHMRRKTPDPNLAPEIEYDSRNAAKKTVPDPRPILEMCSYDDMMEELKRDSKSIKFDVVEGHHY